MTEKQLYQLSLLYQMIESTSCGKLVSFMSVDPTCLSALKHIVSETHGLSGQQSKFLNVKANQLLKVVRHVKQNFQDVKLKINENFDSTNILSEKQKKMMELKQKKIKNICGQLLIEKLNKEKNNNLVEQEQMQLEAQQVGQQYSIQQPNESKVSKASTGNRQLKKMKFEQVNIKQNNKNSSKVPKGNEGQNQNRKKEPIKINLIQQRKGKNRNIEENQKMVSNSNNQNHSNHANHYNQENMMNSSNLVAANLFKRQKVHDILSHVNMDLSQLSRPQYRKTQNFRQKELQYQDMPIGYIHMTNQSHNENHKKVLLKKHNHESEKIQMKKNSKLGEKNHHSKDNKQNRQRQRQKSPLIKRIMKTQYEQAQIYDDNQVSQNNNSKFQKQIKTNYHQKRKYNDYFASTTAATDDQDDMLNSNVNSKINKRNNIRKTQRISNEKNQQKKLNEFIKEENNFNHNINNDKNKSNCCEYQRPKSPKFQGRKANKKINLSKNGNTQSMSNISNQNQTFKTDELFDSHLTEKVQNNEKERRLLQSGYSSESQILRLQAQFQKDIQQINNKNREEQNQKKQTNLKGNSKKYPQNNYEKVVQEEPWECDELQLQEELKAIDQKLSHRASKSPLSKRGIQTLSHLELKSALHEANQFQNSHQNEPKIVRLSLTPKGCKEIMIKKSKVSMKQTNSKSNLKSKSPQFQKSKSQDKLKMNLNKIAHINPISKVSKFDQDFAFPISIEVQVNKNAHNIGKWNKKLINSNFCSNQQSHMRHPKRKQLLSDQIESINKFY